MAESGSASGVYYSDSFDTQEDLVRCLIHRRELHAKVLVARQTIGDGGTGALTQWQGCLPNARLLPSLQRVVSIAQVIRSGGPESLSQVYFLTS